MLYHIRQSFTGNDKPTVYRETESNTRKWFVKNWKCYLFTLPCEAPEGYTDCYIELVNSNGQVEKRSHCRSDEVMRKKCDSE